MNGMSAALIIAIFCLFLTRPKIGALAYLAAILLAPTIAIGGATPRIELVLVPLGLIARMLFRTHTWRRPGLSLWLAMFVVWWIWLAFVTIVSPEATNWTGLYGVARLIGVSILFCSIEWTEDDIVRAQWIYLLSAIPVGLLTMGQLLGFGWAMTITNVGYSPASAAVIANQQLAQDTFGGLFRGVAVFGNVSPAGAYFVLVIAVGLLLAVIRPWARPQKILLIACISIAFIGGFATLSGTFFGGLAVVWGVALIAAPANARGRVLRRVVVWGGLGLLLATILVGRDEMIRAQVQYQFDRLVSSGRLQGRYGSEGITYEAWQYVLANPIQGAGLTYSSIFSGDSLYLSVLFPTGFVGAVLFALPIVALMWLGWRGGVGSRFVLVWTLGILLIGISCNGMFIARLGDWWWAMQGMLISAWSLGTTELVTNRSFERMPRNPRGYMRSSSVRPL
jgi:hypothetical protein